MIQTRTDIVESIHEAGVQEAIEHLQLPFHFLESFVEPIISDPIYKFAHIADEYDQRVEQEQLADGTKWFLDKFVTSMTIKGQENIPAEGPLLITPNHAGGVDFLTVMASIPRNDLRVISNEHEIIKPTTCIKDYLLLIGEKSADRPSTIYHILNELKAGHAVLAFPAGVLEPDPKTVPGGQDHLDFWSPSIGIFAKKINDLRILPVVIGGTVSPLIYESFYSRIRKSVKRRTKTAILLQYLNHLMRPGSIPIDIEVTIGKPLSAEDLPINDHPKEILKEVVKREKALMNEVYPQSGRSLGKWY